MQNQFDGKNGNGYQPISDNKPANPKKLSKAILGRDFIKMIAPILGIDNIGGIRSIEISAAFDDVTTVKIEMLPSQTDADLFAEKTNHAGTYIVSVTKIASESEDYK